jgi:hypothetical protein
VEKEVEAAAGVSEIRATDKGAQTKDLLVEKMTGNHRLELVISSLREPMRWTIGHRRRKPLLRLR